MPRKNNNYTIRQMTLAMMKQTFEAQLQYLFDEIHRHEKHLKAVKAPNMADMDAKDLKRMSNQGAMLRKIAEIERKRRTYHEASQRILRTVQDMEIPILNDAAVEIQRHFRGGRDRTYVNTLRNTELRRVKAVILQRWYRRLVWTWVYHRAMRAIRNLQKMMLVCQIQRLFRNKRKLRELPKTKAGRQEMRKEMYRRKNKRKVHLRQTRNLQQKATAAAVIIQTNYRTAMSQMAFRIVMAQRAKRKLKMELLTHLYNVITVRWRKVVTWRDEFEQRVRVMMHPKLAPHLKYLIESDWNMAQTLRNVRKDSGFCAQERNRPPTRLFYLLEACGISRSTAQDFLSGERGPMDRALPTDKRSVLAARREHLAVNNVSSELRSGIRQKVRKGSLVKQSGNPQIWEKVRVLRNTALDAHETTRSTLLDAYSLAELHGTSTASLLIRCKNGCCWGFSSKGTCRATLIFKNKLVLWRFWSLLNDDLWRDEKRKDLEEEWLMVTDFLDDVTGDFEFYNQKMIKDRENRAADEKTKLIRSLREMALIKEKSQKKEGGAAGGEEVGDQPAYTVYADSAGGAMRSGVGNRNSSSSNNSQQERGRRYFQYFRRGSLCYNCACAESNNAFGQCDECHAPPNYTRPTATHRYVAQPRSLYTARQLQEPLDSLLAHCTWLASVPPSDGRRAAPSKSGYNQAARQSARWRELLKQKGLNTIGELAVYLFDYDSLDTLCRLLKVPLSLGDALTRIIFMIEKQIIERYQALKTNQTLESEKKTGTISGTITNARAQLGKAKKALSAKPKKRVAKPKHAARRGSVAIHKWDESEVDEGSIQLPPLRQRRFEIGMPMPVHLDPLEHREMIWEEQLANVRDMKEQASSQLALLRSSSVPAVSTPGQQYGVSMVSVKGQQMFYTTGQQNSRTAARHSRDAITRDASSSSSYTNLDIASFE